MISEANVLAFAHAHYDFKWLQMAPLTDKVFQLRTAQKDYVLKFSSDDDFLMKQMYAHKELPDHVLPLYKTRAGETVARLETGFAYLTDHVFEVPMPLEKRVSQYAELLGKLHAATGLEVEKHEVEISDAYQVDYQKIERNFALLEQRMSEIELKVARSPFEWYVMMVYPLLYGMYRRSDAAMQRFYRGLSRKKQLPVAMVHGDVNVANLLPCAKESYLINFEKSEFAVPGQDLVRFLRHYHQLPGVKGMVSRYLKAQKNPLIVHDFFMHGLCVDLEAALADDAMDALPAISILNESVAPGMVAMQIYDELSAPKQSEAPAAQV